MLFLIITGMALYFKHVAAAVVCLVLGFVFYMCFRLYDNIEEDLALCKKNFNRHYHNLDDKIVIRI